MNSASSGSMHISFSVKFIYTVQFLHLHVDWEQKCASNSFLQLFSKCYSVFINVHPAGYLLDTPFMFLKAGYLSIPSWCFEEPGSSSRPPERSPLGIHQIEMASAGHQRRKHSGYGAGGFFSFLQCYQNSHSSLMYLGYLCTFCTGEGVAELKSSDR